MPKVYNNHTTHEFKSCKYDFTGTINHRFLTNQKARGNSFYKILKVAAENHIGRSYSDSVIKTIIGSKFSLLMLLYCLFVWFHFFDPSM